MEIYPHLLPILSCPSQKKIVRAGRRVGKTQIIVREVLLALTCIPDFVAMVVAPFRDQIELVHDRIMQEIDVRFVRRHVRQPNPVIEMSNGSRCILRVLPFPVGMGTNIDGIWADEFDFLSERGWDQFLAITASSVDPYIYLTGCPGMGDSRFAQDWVGRGFTEFHLPSYIVPTWTPQIEAWLRTQYSEEVFRHEFLAEY